ncbi:MAG: hypothetical protein KGJ13_11140 [Patescibacteria group bacterium]|nr:hypothetical protein [Patescibacteria group bacterium]
MGESGSNVPQIRIDKNRLEEIRKDSCTDSAEASSLPDEKDASHGRTRSVIEYSYESGSLTGVGADDIADWERAYPAVDVRRNIAAAAVWLGANPQKRKKNIRRFLVNWFSRAQEKGGDKPGLTQPRVKSPISTGLAAIAATRQRRPDD